MTKLFLFFYFILALVNPFRVIAKEYFSDDFSNEQHSWSDWDFVNIQSSDISTWKVINGKLQGNVVMPQSSLLINNRFYDLKNYSFSFKVENFSGVDQWILFRVSEDKVNYYLLDFRYMDLLWPQDNNDIRLYKHDSGGFHELKRVNGGNFMAFFNIAQNIERDVRIDLIENNIKVTFDKVLVLDFFDSIGDYFRQGSFGFGNWSGSYYHRAIVNNFDDVSVTDLISDIKVSKIVLIPGLGASWNTKAIIANIPADNNEWKMNSFVHNYDGFVNALKNNGLEENEDFFVWNYDWREPVSEISEKLDEFLDEELDGEDFYLVGHSLGGLVARDWLQNNKEDTRLKKVFTLGSPHYGVVKAYEAWSGGKISDNLDFGTIALNVLIQLQRKNFESNVEVIRNYVPVLKDILPDFPFLKKNNLVLNKSMYSNNYLIDANPRAVEVFNKLSEYNGIGVDTKEWINLKDSSAYEKTLSMWLEGKPESYESGAGDGTVLSKSAKFTDDSDGENKEFGANHGELVDKSIDELLTVFGLEGEDLAVNDYDWGGKLIYYIGSPAFLEANCSDGQRGRSDEMGFLILDSGDSGTCRISIIATDEGAYHVAYGKVGEEDNWKYFEGLIDSGDIKFFDVGLDGGQMLGSKENLNFVKDLIKNYLKVLMRQYPESKHLAKAYKGLEKGNIYEMMGFLFRFRKETKETVTTNMIMENLVLWMEYENKNIKSVRAKAELKVTSNLKKMIDWKTHVFLRKNKNPSQLGAKSYLLMEDYMESQNRFYNTKNFGKSFAYGRLASFLANEVW